MNKVYGLVGEKLSHSFSPLIHSVLWSNDYRLFPMSRDEFDSFISARQFSGINVTIPYKVAAFEKCDEVDSHSRAIGSVNTIVNCGGKLLGSNTDYAGFLYCAHKILPCGFAGKKVLILGSGGSSRTIVAAVSDEGCRQAVVISRHGENNYQNLQMHFDADIIVNTTPVGMFPHTDDSPIDLSQFENCSAVIDLIYNPLCTRLLFNAKERGIPCTNGLPMLANQGAESAKIFSGRDFDEDDINRVVSLVSKDKQNIVLVGMPGCGKSTVGKIVASRLQREFFDTDSLVEEASGRRAGDIIAESGEAAFRQLESEAILKISLETGAVIACGGGSLVRKENRFNLRKNGVGFFVERQLDLLSILDRPLSKDCSSLEKLYKDRLPFYLCFSSFTVSNNSTAQQCADEICSYFVRSDS